MSNFLIVYDTPDKTLREWQKKLNNILDKLSSSGYVNVTAQDVSIVDSGSYFTSKNVEYALQYLANISLNGITKVTTKSITSLLTVSEAGFVICNSASNIIINLPTAIGNIGLVYSITNINSGIVTIDPFSTQTLQGETTFDIYQDESISIVSNGANWYIK
jgi:hypothetical protein